MNYSALLLSLVTLISMLTSQAIAAPDTWVFFGCVGENPGIYRSTLDSATGALTKPERIHEGGSMSFLALSADGTRLYAVGRGELGGAAIAFAVDARTGDLEKLNQEDIGSGGACHISVTPDGKTISTADYGNGCVTSFGVNDDGSLKQRDPACFFAHEGSSVNAQRQEKPHAHCVVPSPDGKFVYSADLGADSIFIYAVEEPGKLGLTKAIKVKNLGGGPRHFAFHPDGKFAYTNLELTSKVTAFSVDSQSGALHELGTVSTLPAPHEGNSTSELLCHPSGKFFYCANRGHNSIAAFRFNADGSLTSIGHEPCGGDVPRNFGISPDGGWIITANQNSNNAGVLKVDTQTGKLSLLEDGGVELPKPMCARFLPIAK